MIKLFSQLYSTFDKRQKQGFLWMLPLMFLMGVFDVIGIAFVFPFMAIAVDPSKVESHHSLAKVYHLLNFNNVYHFIVLFGICVLIALVIADLTTAYVNWRILKYSCTTGYQFGLRLLKKYLTLDYSFYMQRNGVDLAKNVVAEVDNVTTSVLVPYMFAISKLMGVVVILALIIVANPMLALSMAIVLSSAYLLIYKYVRKRLLLVEKQRFKDIQYQYRVTTEGFSGIKEIKLLGKEENFLAQYGQAAKRFASNNIAFKSIATLPRYFVEIIAFGSVIMIVIALMLQHKHITDVIPLLALYAFACYRLLPSVQQIFSSITTIKSYQASLDMFRSEMGHEIGHPHYRYIEGQSSKNRQNLRRAIILKNICFAYQNKPDFLFKKLSLTIKANSTVGLVGTTGAGKTTLVDIILGLLKPYEGHIHIDDTSLNDESLRAWQNNIGYVPQHIFLYDDSVLKNIAFGVPEEDIDVAQVKAAAEIANIAEFIEQELEDGYATVVGDKGIRLSGGQRQRIGIARALYHDPQVLVFDEATSALDGVSESLIMQSIEKLAHKKTIILIAHRLNTVKHCDCIHVMERGEIIDSGTYQQLMLRNPQFKNMATSHFQQEQACV